MENKKYTISHDILEKMNAIARKFGLKIIRQVGESSFEVKVLGIANIGALEDELSAHMGKGIYLYFEGEVGDNLVEE